MELSIAEYSYLTWRTKDDALRALRETEKLAWDDFNRLSDTLDRKQQQGDSPVHLEMLVNHALQIAVGATVAVYSYMERK